MASMCVSVRFADITPIDAIVCEIKLRASHHYYFYSNCVTVSLNCMYVYVLLYEESIEANHVRC